MGEGNDKFEEMEKELTDLVAKYMDHLMPIQLIALLEVKKLTLAHLVVKLNVEEIDNKVNI